MDPKLVLLAWELYQKNVLINDIAKHCKKHRSTISRWISGIKNEGLNTYIVLYNNAKNIERPGRQVNQHTKDLIRKIKNTHPSKSGYQIKTILNSEYGLQISTSKVYEILRTEI